MKFHLYLIIPILVLTIGCKKEEPVSDPLNSFPESDCIDICSQYGEAIPSASDTVEYCECDCIEGFFGNQCTKYLQPDGYAINKITLLDFVSNEFDPDEGWPDILPDVKLVIRVNGSFYAESTVNMNTGGADVVSFEDWTPSLVLVWSPSVIYEFTLEEVDFSPELISTPVASVTFQIPADIVPAPQEFTLSNQTTLAIGLSGSWLF